MNPLGLDPPDPLTEQMGSGEENRDGADVDEVPAAEGEEVELGAVGGNTQADNEENDEETEQTGTELQADEEEDEEEDEDEHEDDDGEDDPEFIQALVRESKEAEKRRKRVGLMIG